MLGDHWGTTGVQATTSYTARATTTQWDGEQCFKWLSFVRVCPVQPCHYRCPSPTVLLLRDQPLWGFQQLTRIDNINRGPQTCGL